MLIDTDVVEKYGLTMPEFIVLMLVMHKVNVEEAQRVLVSKGYILNTLNFEQSFGYAKTKFGVEVYNNIILESSPQPTVTEERLHSLAARIKEIYPKGKKDGTWYWADGVELIARRLRIFFHKYDKEGKLTDDQIINATQRYVDEMQGKPDMRLLKYFIFKEAVGKGGDVEPTSDLLTYIENTGQTDERDPDDFVTLF